MTSAVDRSTLPSNVRRWLDRSVPQNAVIPDGVRIAQEGDMMLKPDTRWTPFTAQQDFEVHQVGFVWRAHLRFTFFLWVAVEDALRGDRGWGGARFWGLIPAGRRRLEGPEVLKSQLIRNLAEIPLVPEAALANPDLGWADTDDGGFQVKASSGGMTGSVRFWLDDGGDVVRAFAPDRPRDVKDGFVDTPFRGAWSDQTDRWGIRVPTYGEATLELPEGPFTYWRGRITERRSF